MEFEPELILTCQHPLGKYATIYLNGDKLARCYEARIKWLSFEEPTFGEVIIDADEDYRPTVMYKPRLGEFEYEGQGIWVKLACGQVKIELDDEGKKLLKLIIKQLQ